MVLQLSTSPFASRAASSSHSSSSSSSSSSSALDSSSTQISSASSASSHFSFFSERAKGFQHGHGYSRNRRSSSTSWMSTFTLAKNKSLARSTVIQTCRHNSSIDLWARNAFRLFGIISGIFTLVVVPTLKDSGLKTGFGRGTQYLTILSLCLTIISLSLGIAGDFLKKQDLLRIKDAMLPVITPGECAVGVLYWYLTLSNVYHIYPDGNRYIPFWIDFQMHGLPALFVLVEMFYFSKTFQVKRLTDFCAISMFALFYMGWSSLCAHIDGEWPYPILQNLDCPWKRLRMMFTSYLIYVALHFIISETHIRSRAAREFRHIIETAKESL